MSEQTLGIALLNVIFKKLASTKKGFWCFLSEGALSSVVEHYLHTVGVAGSKPAARTISLH